jgi:hypothetical protein
VELSRSCLVSLLVLALLLVPAVQLMSPVPGMLAHHGAKTTGKVGGPRAIAVVDEAVSAHPLIVAAGAVSIFECPAVLSDFSAAPFVPPRA